MAAPTVWEEDFRVLTFHMDPKGKAHLSSICNFLQEGASMHAAHAGFGYEYMMSNSQVWVLARQKVIIDAYPVWNDQLKLKTWSRGKEGIFYIRDFIIENEKNETIIKATTSWAAINIKTRRPELVTGLEDGLTSFKEKVAIGEKLNKLPELVNAEFTRKRQIEYTDIDLVYHVNNVKYIELIMNSFPLKTHKQKEVKTLEINYLGEAKYGEDVSISIEQNPGHEHKYLVNIIRESDKKEVCRASLEWE
jgi:medium-chain acyl-[acyl-carrier-protein] hydrolase